MIRLERVSKYYFTGNQVVQALRRVSFSCGVGEFIAITGESGSGKSTLLNVMSGLDTYEEGVVYYNGKDLSHYGLDELEAYRRDAIGYVFQEFNIIDSLTVFQNVELALTIAGVARAERRRRTSALLAQVGLAAAAHRQAGKLSGGEKQRTVIARTLAKDCRVLVCDEPTGNLNEAAARGIFALLRTIAKDRLVVVVTHDARLAEEYATRRIRLFDGEIVEDTAPREDADEIVPETIRKPGPTRSGAVAIGLWNLLSAPKKALLTLVTLFFLAAMSLLLYGTGLVQAHLPVAVANRWFVNTTASRIILTKDDGTSFTGEELALLETLDGVRGVFPDDAVFDLELVAKVYDAEAMKSTFLSFLPMPALALAAEDLVEGRLPENDHEVVLVAGGSYAVGDEVTVASAHLLALTQALAIDQYGFTVVGLVGASTTTDAKSFFLANAGLSRLAPAAILARSQVEFEFAGTAEYDLAGDVWVSPDDDPDVTTRIRPYLLTFPLWVDVDDTLADGTILTFDLFFFDVCRDFGYKAEIVDDFDAGLCDADAFLAHHTTTLRVTNAASPTATFVPVDVVSVAATAADQSQKLYMNAATFAAFFNAPPTQVTVLVRDTFEGRGVARTLADQGYDVLVPAAVLSASEVLAVLVRNVLTALVVAILFAVLFFVGRFVLRGLLLARRKDYLVLRSLGVARKGVRRIVATELAVLALGAVLLVGATVVLAATEPLVAGILRYLRWGDVAILLLIGAGALSLLAAGIAAVIFRTGVVAALKGAER